MKIVMFGATGMVGQGVLRECLLDPDVEQVLAVGRRPIGHTHPKLRDLVHDDFGDLAAVAEQFAGYDACFYCLGVSAAGMSPQRYEQISYDYPLAAARVLAERIPGSTFVYVSGQGTDSSEQGRIRWARVKGRTENALLRLPLTAVMFRPGFIIPGHGIVSRTRLYRMIYGVATPLLPVLRRVAPGQVTTTEEVGRAMLAVAKHGAPRPILGNREIATLARG